MLHPRMRKTTLIFTSKSLLLPVLHCLYLHLSVCLYIHIWMLNPIQTGMAMSILRYYGYSPGMALAIMSPLTGLPSLLHAVKIKYMCLTANFSLGLIVDFVPCNFQIFSFDIVIFSHYWLFCFQQTRNPGCIPCCDCKGSHSTAEDEGWWGRKICCNAREGSSHLRLSGQHHAHTPGQLP